VIIDLIPKIYDTARAARIIGEDGEPKIVKLNEEFDDNGKPTIYALDAGRYDATVDVGPSFATKRQEAAASMIDISRANPAIMQTAGDLIVRNMDWPGAQDIADRLKKTLPPGLADDENKSKELPPQVTAQMQQMDQMIQQLTDRIHSLQDEKEQKLVELESRERIEFKKLEVQLEIKRAELDARDSHALLSAEIDQINNRLSYLDMNEPIQFEQDEPQEQNFPPQSPDGAQVADSELGEQEPIGGFSPSTNIEGNYNG
jgi:ribosome-associated translation inhibitor RaiA